MQPIRRDPVIETTIRALYEIYHEELLKQKRGLPLWFPGPSSDLPLTYRRDGINIGDVGIMQLDEPFDFLFNIFLPASHPINSKGVPDLGNAILRKFHAICKVAQLEARLCVGMLIANPRTSRYIYSRSPLISYEGFNIQNFCS